MDIFTIINALATTVLAIITGYYAWVTGKILKETSTQRMDGAMPFLLSKKFEINGDEGGEMVCIKAEILNVGKAIALNVDVIFIDPETAAKIAESSHLISTINQGDTEENLHIHIEQDMFHNIKFENRNGKMVAFLDCRMDFEDIYGRSFSVIQSFVYDKDDRKFEHVDGPISFDILGS